MIELPPPRPNEGAPLLTPEGEILETGTPELYQKLNKIDLDKSLGIVVYTCAFFQDGFGSSCAYIRIGKDTPMTEGWVMGEDHTSLGPPDYVVEGSFLHALRIVDALTTHGGIDWSTIHQVTIGTSGQHWPSVLAKWFRHNTFELQSSAASEIITTLERVKLRLNCPLFFTSLPSDFLEILSASDQSPSGTILETAKKAVYAHNTRSPPTLGRQHIQSSMDQKRSESTP